VNRHHAGKAVKFDGIFDITDEKFVALKFKCYFQILKIA
jgi:hypothetical protein